MNLNQPWLLTLLVHQNGYPMPTLDDATQSDLREHLKESIEDYLRQKHGKLRGTVSVTGTLQNV